MKDQYKIDFFFDNYLKKSTTFEYEMNMFQREKNVINVHFFYLISLGLVLKLRRRKNLLDLTFCRILHKKRKKKKF